MLLPLKEKCSKKSLWEIRLLRGLFLDCALEKLVYIICSYL